MKSLLSDALVFMLSPNNSFALVQHSARDALSVPESAGAPGNQQHRAFILRQARHWAWQHQCWAELSPTEVSVCCELCLPAHLESWAGQTVPKSYCIASSYLDSATECLTGDRAGYWQHQSQASLNCPTVLQRLVHHPERYRAGRFCPVQQIQRSTLNKLSVIQITHTPVPPVGKGSI